MRSNVNFTKISLLVASAAFISACEKTKNSEQAPGMIIPADIAGPQITIDSLPLTLGNSWTYEVTEQTVYDDGQKSEITSYTVQLTVASEAIATGERIAGISGNSYGLRNFAAADTTHIYGYLNKPEGTYENQELDPLIVNKDTGLLMIKLPIVINEKWSQPTAWYPNSIFREWKGYYTVRTTAGNFNCAKLTCTTVDVVGTETAEEYYSPKGLIQAVKIKQGTTWGGGILGGGSKGFKETRVVKLKAINF